MTFSVPLSGLSAMQENINVIANNIANASTVGFKSGGLQFQSLYAAGVGNGVIASSYQNFSNGTILGSSNSLDLAINGSGFFTFQNNAGQNFFSRNGQFQINSDGYIINSNGQFLMGQSITEDPTSNVLQKLFVNTANVVPQASTTMSIGVNLNSATAAPVNSPFDPTDATTYNNFTSSIVYDSVGNSDTVNLYFAQSGTANEWNVYAVVNGVTITPQPPASIPTVAFNSDGTYSSITPSPLSMIIPAIGGAAAVTFSLDLSNSTQFSSPFAVNQNGTDGFPTGSITGISVGGNGALIGTYTNGQQKTLAYIPLATFAHQEALDSQGNNTWSSSINSGQPIYNLPGSGSNGSIISGATETSNVDLPTELVSMIAIQEAYSANAKVLSTMDSMIKFIIQTLA